MSVISTGDFVKDLEPLTGAWVDQGAARYGEEYAKIFQIVRKEAAYFEDQTYSTLGMLQRKPEGDSVRYDKMSQRWGVRYTPTPYALGVNITLEAIADGTALDKAQMALTELGRSCAELRNTLAHDYLNTGFTVANGGDGKALLATDHPTDDGVTSNELATPAALSEASLKQLFIEMKDMTDLRGNRIRVMPKKLIVPRALMFDADVILKSEYKPGVADNDINSIVSTKLIPGGHMVSDWLSSSTAWFVLTDNDNNGLKFFDRVPMMTMKDKDTDTFNAKIVVYTRFGVGHTNYNCIVGSAGA